MSEDIFEKYAELAMERGLVSKGEDLKKKLEKNPRWDSQDISAIELLYGVKPDSPKEMEYKKNIVEIAHPNAVVVSTSHDRLNGLVENLNERNNIMINIVNKPVDGHLYGRRYASDELVRSLVRIANDMDNKNSDKLRILADRCIEQMNKKSWVQLAIGAGAALLGGVYLQQHADMANIGLEGNAIRLIGELEDFLGDHLIGTVYTENFQKTIQKLIDRVNLLLTRYKQFKNEIDTLQKPKDFEEMTAYVSGSGSAVEGSPLASAEFPKIYQEFNDLVNKSDALFGQIEKRFIDQSYKTEQMKEVGIGERINRFFGGVFTGDKKSLATDDFIDVLKALAPFKQSLVSVLNVLKKADQEAKQEFETMKSEHTAKMSGNKPPTGQEPTQLTGKKPAKKTNPLEGFDFDAAEKALKR